LPEALAVWETWDEEAVELDDGSNLPAFMI
jgi:hypothetical protein